MGEAGIKSHRIIDLLDIFLSKLQGERHNIGLEMVHLSTTDDGKDIRGLVHDICQCDAGDECVLTVSDRLQHSTGSNLLVTGLDPSPFLSISLLLTLELAATKRSPRGNSHAFSSTHGNDVSFEIARSCGPTALVNGELAKSIAASVLVCLAMELSATFSGLIKGFDPPHNPSGSITDAKMKNFPGLYKLVERLHQLLNRGASIVPMNVELRHG